MTEFETYELEILIYLATKQIQSIDSLHGIVDKEQQRKMMFLENTLKKY